jgi:hypothetical protein
MRKIAVLVGLACSLTAILILVPSHGSTRDMIILAMLACLGVYVSFTMPINGS